MQGEGPLMAVQCHKGLDQCWSLPLVSWRDWCISVFCSLRVGKAVLKKEATLVLNHGYCYLKWDEMELKLLHLNMSALGTHRGLSQ